MHWISAMLSESASQQQPLFFYDGRIIKISDILKFETRFHQILQKKGLKAGDTFALIGSEKLTHAMAILASINFGLNVIPIHLLSYGKYSRSVLSKYSLGEISLPDNGTDKINIKYFENAQAIYSKDIQGSIIVMTSGSTGVPKFIPLTPEVLFERAEIESTIFPIRPGDRILNVTSFGHELGLNQIFTSLMTQSTLVFGASSLQSDIIEMIQQSQCRGVIATPMFWQRLCRIKNPIISNIQWISISGGSLDTESHQIIQKLFSPEQIIRTYGKTETGRTLYNNFPNFMEPNNLGVPVPGVTVQFCENTLNTNLSKELVHFGKGIALSSERTTGHSTGDFFSIDPQGNYLFQGRKDDLIKRFDLRISVIEIENDLMQTQLIIKAVVLTADGINRWGTMGRLIAFIEPKENVSLELIEKSILSELPKAKIPDLFVQINDWPLTHSTKIDTSKLKELVK